MLSLNQHYTYNLLFQQIHKLRYSKNSKDANVNFIHKINI